MGLRKEERSSPEYQKNMKIHERANAILKEEGVKKEEQLKRTGNAYYGYIDELNNAHYVTDRDYKGPIYSNHPERLSPEVRRRGERFNEIRKLAYQEYGAGRYFSKHGLTRLAIKAYKNAEDLDSMCHGSSYEIMGYGQSEKESLYRKGKLEGVQLMHRRRKGRKSPFEEAMLALSLIGFLGGIFFFSPNITGNVIGNLNKVSTNWIGVVLLIIGLSGLWYFKNK